MGTGTILVTGAAGLIGHAVCRRLVEAGESAVGIDRAGGSIDGLDVVECDVTNIHGLHGLTRRFDITGIIHCGAFSGPMVAADTPALMVDVNIAGTANILEIARQVGGVRVVFCSSTSAIGPIGPGPHDEDIIPHPSSVYGASKAASEFLVQSWKRQHGVDGVSLRISWVYGPRRTTACAIRRMITDGLAGRATHLPFGRDFRRQYVHVNDVSRALVLALGKRDLPRMEYFITGNSWLTLGDIARMVEEIVPGARIQVEAGADPVDDWQGQFDISNAARDLGYQPQITLRDGIASYRDWLAAR